MAKVFKKKQKVSVKAKASKVRKHVADPPGVAVVDTPLEKKVEGTVVGATYPADTKIDEYTK